MTINKQTHSLAFQSLMLAAVTLPGIQATNAETAITRPETDIRYTLHDEGTNRYKIDIYKGFLKIPLGPTMDLEVEAGQDVMSGATPVIYVQKSALEPGANPSELSEIRSQSSIYVQRREIKVKPRFFGDDYHVGVHGIVSEEEDYESITGGIDYTQDLNKQNTSLKGSYSFSKDAVNATTEAVGSNQVRNPNRSERNTHRFGFDIKQDLTTTTRMLAGVEFITDRGYLDDPYKEIAIWGDASTLRSNTYLFIPPFNFTIAFDRRPKSRGTLGTSIKLIQHISPLDSTVHFAYRYVQNTWSIKSHTFTLDYYQQLGSAFEIVPSARYYAQNEAYFYAMAFDIVGGAPFPSKRIYGNEPASSDYRLARYGSIAGELKFNYKFLSDQSGKLTFLMGVINRRNKFYWGSKPKLPNPSNEFKTHYCSLGLSFVF